VPWGATAGTPDSGELLAGAAGAAAGADTGAETGAAAAGAAAAGAVIADVSAAAISINSLCHWRSRRSGLPTYAVGARENVNPKRVKLSTCEALVPFPRLRSTAFFGLLCEGMGILEDGNFLAGEDT
jgi:hypothetical protein